MATYSRRVDSKSRGLSLRRNFSWTFVGNTIYAAAQWGMLVVLAKLGSPELVGQFSLALAITAPIILFTNLQLRSVQATDATEEYTPRMYLALRLVMTLVGLVVIGLLIVTGGYEPETGLVIVIVGLAKGIEAVSDILYGFLQHREHMNYIAKSMIIKGLLSLVTMAITVFLTKSMACGALALLLMWAVTLFGYDIPSVRRVARLTTDNPDSLDIQKVMVPDWNWRRLLQLVWLSLPLGFVMMLISLNTSIPRVIMEQHYGVAELGIFSAWAYLIVAGTTVVQALGQSAAPRLAQYYAAQQSGAFMSLVLKLLGVGAVLAVGGILIAWIGGRELLTLIYDAKYAERADVFVLIMVAGGLGYVASFAGYTLTAARYFRVQTMILIIVTLTTFVSSQLLIPGQGSLGAAYVLVIAAVVQLAMMLLVTIYAAVQLRKTTAGA